MLTDPDLPEVVETDRIFGRISLREGDGHSVTMTDRRPWARDIALYLAGLTRSGQVAGPGRWSQLAGHPGAGAVADAASLAGLRAALETRERDLRLARHEAQRLRAELGAALGAELGAELAPPPPVRQGAAAIRNAAAPKALATATG